MKAARIPVILLVLATAILTTAPAVAQAPTAEQMAAYRPQPTVPEVFAIQGQYVRTAYNNEGIVNLGYRIANGSVGEDWMYLQAAVAMRSGQKYQTLKREAFSVKLPDGTIVPLATQKDYSAALGLQALNARAKVQKDSLSYFEPGVRRVRNFRFFADLGGKGNPTSFDEADVDDLTAVVGRFFFKIPGKIQPGLHYFIVKFKTSEVQVPFRILTKEEDKEFKKTWQDFQKALEAEFEK
jgi:hypothetical protein